MSFFSRQCAVRYVCTCGELKPISRIYFCRHCSAVRCSFCVSHEVDVRYCPICLENLPVAEAWMKNNCCSACIICPICHLNLTTRMTTVKNKEGAESSDKEEGKTEAKRFYYLRCLGCHWTSRDVGLPDQTTASATWPEYENPFSVRLNELMEYYKAVSLNDKIISEKKQPSAKRSYSHLTGMSAAMVRRKVGLPTYLGGQYTLAGFQEVRKLPNIKPSVATSEINDLAESVFTEAPDLIKVTTLEQRLGITDLQCTSSSELKPRKKLLLTKRSQRCRECEHNVTKPEFNPSSTKFKILISAYYHIPNISVKKCDPLIAGKECDFIVHLVNPTTHQITVSFFPFDTEIKKQPPSEQSQVGPEPEETQEEAKQKKRIPLKIDYLTKVEPRPIAVDFTGVAILPNCAVILPRRDDAAEYDDTTENQNFNDDKRVVVWRKGNQAAIKLSVRPNDDLELGAEVIVGFQINHTYFNSIIQDKSQQEINHQVKIVLTPGKIAS